MKGTRLLLVTVTLAAAPKLAWCQDTLRSIEFEALSALPTRGLRCSIDTSERGRSTEPGTVTYSFELGDEFTSFWRQTRVEYDSAGHLMSLDEITSVSSPPDGIRQQTSVVAFSGDRARGLRVTGTMGSALPKVEKRSLTRQEQEQARQLGLALWKQRCPPPLK